MERWVRDLSLAAHDMVNSSIVTGQCQERAEAAALTAIAGFPDSDRTLITACIALCIHSLIAGSCFQMIYQLAFQNRRDSWVIKSLVAWTSVFSVGQLFLWNYQVVGFIKSGSEFAPFFFIGYGIWEVAYLFFMLTSLPIFLFFTYRAYMIWDRSRIVLGACLGLIIPNFVIGIAVSAVGLHFPKIFHKTANDEFLVTISRFQRYAIKFRHLNRTSVCLQLVASSLLCITICYGIFRHRNGVHEMDNAISKIVFLSGESLIPVVLVTLAYVIGSFRKDYATYIVSLEVTLQLAPAVYFHGLMTSLVGRDRVANILKAEPVRGLSGPAPGAASSGPPDPHWSAIHYNPDGIPDFVSPIKLKERQDKTIGSNSQGSTSSPTSPVLSIQQMYEKKESLWEDGIDTTAILEKGRKSSVYGLDEILSQNPSEITATSVTSRSPRTPSTLLRDVIRKHGPV